MLQNRATLREVRSFLHREIRKVYSEGETSSMVPMILEYLGFPKTVYLTEPQLRPGHRTMAQIKEIVGEIHNRRPIQYILGYATFFDLSISVDENVLIPRPETEEMVHRIIERMREPPARILDVGTGSGCIALALKKAFPGASVTGLELSGPALDLARMNGLRNGLEVEWIEGNLLDPAIQDQLGGSELVVSNPPYVLPAEKKQMERNVLAYEPHRALFVEENDPFRLYRAIADLAKRKLSSDGVLWLEINERFGSETAGYLHDAGFFRISVIKDIHEKDRFIEARK
jgi:release factor glutamine methyltransferase